jgi:molybdenum cofactor cytidylyltransferase
MSFSREGTIFSVILAAGKSQRLGTPKSLLKINNDILINFLVKRLKNHNITIIIVTREELISEIKNFTEEVEIISNNNPETGRTGSLQVGLNFILENYSNDFKALIVPVDRPGFSSSTLSKLISLDYTACPEKEGKGGHPLLLSKSDVKKVLNQNPAMPLRDIIKPKKFEVVDDYLHLNVDTEKDIPILIQFISSLENEDTLECNIKQHQSNTDN